MISFLLVGVQLDVTSLLGNFTISTNNESINIHGRNNSTQRILLYKSTCTYAQRCMYNNVCYQWNKGHEILYISTEQHL